MLVIRVFVPFYFIFEFFFLQLVIRVCTPCFESGLIVLLFYMMYSRFT